jgi:NAD(P)-dependent dehydrogenase (short-subunit alcohol dehydrogenase family)
MSTVLITGASTGIGAATAVHLARRGWTVYAGVRRDDDGRALTALESSLRPLIVDVTDEAQLVAARSRIEGEGRLDGLVNNAGVAIAGPLEFLPPDALRKQFEVNVFGLVAASRIFLPLLRATRGRIVNVGSIGGRMALPFMAPYTASKFAVEALTDSMRLEFRPFGIKTVVIEPGAIKTPIWTKGRETALSLAQQYPSEALTLYGKLIESMQRASTESAQRATSPERVAAAIEAALSASNPRNRYVVGTDAHVQAALTFLPSTWKDAMLGRMLSIGSLP